MIGIIDYGSGNVHAIHNIYKALGVDAKLINAPTESGACSKLILAGVGEFDETILLLKNSGWLDTLNTEVLQKKKPILGICVGMQVMANSSEEGIQEGLGWISGRVMRIDEALIQEKPKLPHMGWNSVSLQVPELLFKNVSPEMGFYFLHSYHFLCDNPADVIAHVQYGTELVCSIKNENIFGCQFHPEKSHANGIQVFKNFAEL